MGASSRTRHLVNRIGPLVALLVTLILVVFVVFNNFRNDESTERRSSGGTEYYKRILLWTTFWSNYSDRWEKIFYRQLSRQCPINTCELVYDHSLIGSADAVVIHPIDFRNTSQLPEKRDPTQPWVFFTLEAPPVVAQFPVDFERLKGVINWTMSYRMDSDIVVPYGRILPKRKESMAKEKTIPENKYTNDKEVLDDPWGTKALDMFAVWMVSHCVTDGRREWYVAELVKHMSVHVYGRCGHMQCGRHITVRTLGTFDQEPCNEEIDKYYFYLAFENAICEDYVTEKFFMALQRNVVPVVFGGADYAAIAPPHSYINALEFESPKQLAEALYYIAANRDMYNRFFEWKKYYSVELGHPFLPMVCDLCSKLHGVEEMSNTRTKSTPSAPEGLEPRVEGKDSDGSYPDIGSWFITGSSCRTWWNGPGDYKKYAREHGIPYRDPKIKH